MNGFASKVSGKTAAQVILYYFSFLQRDCDNLTLYNVVFFHFFLNEFLRR